MCTEGLKVIGFTDEVSSLLQVSDRVLAEILNKSNLDMLFPEATTERGISVLKNPSGGVIEFRARNFFMEGDAADVRSEDIKTELLVWARLVRENYGDTETALIFVFSPILPDSIKLYRSIENVYS